MSEQAPGFRKLPLRKIIVGAFLLPWQHRGELFRATAIPLVAVIACTLIADAADFNLGGAVTLIPGAHVTRATAHTSTRLTPAATSTHFISASVLPVVMTSSTMATCTATNNRRCARAPLIANAPRTLR